MSFVRNPMHCVDQLISAVSRIRSLNWRGQVPDGIAHALRLNSPVRNSGCIVYQIDVSLSSWTDGSVHFPLPISFRRCHLRNVLPMPCASVSWTGCVLPRGLEVQVSVPILEPRHRQGRRAVQLGSHRERIQDSIPPGRVREPHEPLALACRDAGKGGQLRRCPPGSSPPPVSRPAACGGVYCDSRFAVRSVVGRGDALHPECGFILRFPTTASALAGSARGPLRPACPCTRVGFRSGQSSLSSVRCAPIRAVRRVSARGGRPPPRAPPRALR